MTIVIALKVGDGVVLGADSASTLFDGAGNYQNSYFNADKLFNLVKGAPIALATFGLAGLAGRSISSQAKDLRLLLSDKTKGEWHLPKGGYTIEEVATRVRKYFFEDLYTKAFAGAPNPPGLGFLVAGYSTNAPTAEVWEVLIDQGGACGPPTAVIPESAPTSAYWRGQGEACHRLLYGWSPEIGERLVAAGMTPADALKLLNTAHAVLNPTMPIQDAVDLVDYLVEVTCGFVRFGPTPATVAKPIDTAAITKHEGFRWIHRKHYYSRELNLSHPDA